MKKNKLIFILVFTVVIVMFGIGNVTAREKLTCVYEQITPENTQMITYEVRTTYELVYELSSSDSKLLKVTVCHKIPEKEKCIKQCERDTDSETCAKNVCVDSCSDGSLTAFSTELKEGDDCPDIGSNDFYAKILKSYKREFVAKVNCGNIKKIPQKIPKLTSLAFTIIQIAVPILLVLMGSIDLFKGITAGKEDEMKKGQQMFIKRLVVGALIFFVIAIVKLLVSVVANASDTANISSCISCFMSNDCTESVEES
ncbi:MAG: hypothetical protein IJY25_05135 [Bacilli bacterium]|nr:hypothetical protein [Bacilli bacterium]